MAADTRVADVFKLLKTVAKVGDSEGVLETEKLPAEAQPDDELLYRWEPGFVFGYEATDLTGKTITVEAIKHAFLEKENIWIVGNTGTGKSSFVYWMLDELNEVTRRKNRETFARNCEALKKGIAIDKLESYNKLPFPPAPFSCHKQTRVENLEGTLCFKVREDGSREPIVVLNALTDAWTTGKVFVADEVDKPLPGVWAAAHQYFDKRTKTAYIYINGPQKLHKHPEFRVVVTANTLGKGENTVNFISSEVQDDAFLQRFTYFVHLNYMEMPKEIQVVVNKTGIGEAIARKMVICANEIRDAFKESGVSNVLSTRDILSWARECRREESRAGTPSSDTAYWTGICVPSAFPAFLNRIVDLNTREGYGKALGITV